MIRKLFSFTLRSRLEDVLAVGVSAVLVVLLLTTRIFHAFELGPLDFVFILLPIGILGVKSFLGLILASENEGEATPDAMAYLTVFFQPILRIVRDWFPFLLLSVCYYSLYSNFV